MSPAVQKQGSGTGPVEEKHFCIKHAHKLLTNPRARSLAPPISGVPEFPNLCFPNLEFSKNQNNSKCFLSTKMRLVLLFSLFWFFQLMRTF